MEAVRAAAWGALRPGLAWIVASDAILMPQYQAGDWASTVKILQLQTYLLSDRSSAQRDIPIWSTARSLREDLIAKTVFPWDRSTPPLCSAPSVLQLVWLKRAV